MSTLDSIFQRLGRCYRNRIYKGKECNVIIYRKNSSGIKYVYDEEIHKKSIELLQKYNNQILEEETKVELVDNLYSKKELEGTKFYDKFKEGIRVLDNIIDYEIGKNDAKKLLRNIDNIDVIPRSIYDENLKLFEQYEIEKDYKKKSKIRREINKLSISISKSNMIRLRNYITKCPYIEDIFIIDTKYDNCIGLLLEKDEDYEIASRML